MDEKIQMQQKEENKVDKFISDLSDAVKKRVSSLKTQAYIVYGLYLFSFILGITAVIGVIVAYLARESAKKEGIKFLVDNFTYQIRTFWIVVVLVVFGLITTFTVILPFVFFGVAIVWFIYRIITGIMYLRSEKVIYS
ncbi:MAG: hypothetical protein ABDH19_08405 [Thermodesulfovibrio sp.]